jgi:adenosylcobinamide-GDP ribazoletransferase
MRVSPTPALEPIAAAVGFLTRLPLGRSAGPDALTRGAPLFPLVGAAIGGAVGGVAVGSAQVLPALAAGALAAAAELIATGALHADGLADSADGLAGRDRERALAIMRDHSLGAYGASALVLDLVLKAVALGALAEEGAVLPVVAAFALSRAVPLPLAAALPYARPGEGTGRLLAERTGIRAVAAGAALAIAVSVATAGLAALALVACAVAVAAVVGALARRRLGGVTGDVMGAGIELAATLGLVVAVGLAT